MFCVGFAVEKETMPLKILIEVAGFSFNEKELKLSVHYFTCRGPEFLAVARYISLCHVTTIDVTAFSVKFVNVIWRAAHGCENDYNKISLPR